MLKPEYITPICFYVIGIITGICTVSTMCMWTFTLTGITTYMILGFLITYSLAHAVSHMIRNHTAQKNNDQDDHTE